MSEPRQRWTKTVPQLLFWLPARLACRGDLAARELVPGLWVLGGVVDDNPDRLLERYLRRQRRRQ